MDAQGFSVVTPYLESANVQFPTVIDRENLLGEIFGFNAIPNGFLISPDGTVNYQNLGSFDIRNPEIQKVIKRWLGDTSDINIDESILPIRDPVQSANFLFRKGLKLYEEGNVDAALNEWREGVRVDPENYIIKKQIWAVENPSKFYLGEVDYKWQSKQV